MSLYSLKQARGGVAPWSDIVAVGKSIKNLYDSLGNVTISSPTQIATLLDGPEKVVRYGDLVVSSTLTASSRCKGLTIICENLTVQSGGSVNMTGRGARVDRADDPFFPFIDFAIPDQVTISSSLITKEQALALIRQHGFAPWDQGTWQSLVSKLFGFNLAVSQAGQATLMSAAGCGDGAAGTAVGSQNSSAGTSGTAGSNGGMGGGGAGAVYQSGSSGWAVAQKAGKGCPYSGGSGSGGVNSNDWLNNYNLIGLLMASKYSGPGGAGGVLWSGTTGSSTEDGPNNSSSGSGGSGNPAGKPSSTGVAGGEGTGGKLVIICYGSVTVQAGGKIEANGVASGGAASSASNGGGSGGGHVSIITPSLTNSGTIQAAGGSGGTSSSYPKGGDGGAGSVVTKTFAQMGTAWQ